jgi:neutral ceramidase
MVEAGFGQADITPSIGPPLSGFIARENQPSTGIYSPLAVRALALRDANLLYLLLSYDLLGLGVDLENQIQERLGTELGPGFARERCVLTAVHNHSGPPTGILLGEKPSPPDYLERLVSQSVLAAKDALAAVRPSRLFMVERHIPSLTYNRRALLTDGRVSIAPRPDLPIVSRGPLDDRMTILLWRDLSGRNIAGLIHFACHGVAVLSQEIGADIPGELARKIGELIGAPCLFLQGAAGDVNPTTVTAGISDLQSWVEQTLSYLRNLQDGFRFVQDEPIRAITRSLYLNFAPLPSLEDAERNLDALLRIAAGDLNSIDLRDKILSFKNTMNLPSEVALDPAKALFTALTLAEHARLVLNLAQQGGPPPSQPLRVCVWRIGEFALTYLAGEIFASTGLKIRSLSRRLSILPVAYLSPLVGYLPDAEAIALGGYEITDAWRFYGKPAPFAANSETRILEGLNMLIQELEKIS